MDESERLRGDTPGLSLREAIRAARVEAAERSGVIVELRDASLTRLSMLNELLDPIFTEVPLEHAELFDRGLMPGETPRLFVDMVAHVTLARDHRTYRFLQDTRSGRRVLAESANPYDIVDAVTRYVARRLIAREQAMVAVNVPPETTAEPHPTPHHPVPEPAPAATGGWRRAVLPFVLGIIIGALAMLALAVLHPEFSLR
ncbi:hypothetical protein FO470_06865 [Starkeya sp. 3C]|uniref:Type IV / VI secretion system DotU domain-containing protein n=1 Tax=Ancylobacter moscoviensis TaxID=2597768 RepID=A0ABY3DRN5_9HYPH|nr:hypothetical protein [Ancylobacter moscoviensis]TSJ62722.1 hypothetical protein FO470_06865 [Ancylobacter moscoviensis]